MRKRAYQSKPEHPDEEFYRDLSPFQHVIPPASAGEVKDVTGHVLVPWNPIHHGHGRR